MRRKGLRRGNLRNSIDDVRKPCERSDPTLVRTRYRADGGGLLSDRVIKEFVAHVRHAFLLHRFSFGRRFRRTAERVSSATSTRASPPHEANRPLPRLTGRET